MAKLHEDEITLEDIVNFLENESDFSFEMKVLHKLGELGFSCEHGGIYKDPITQKRREFDIRATYEKNNKYFYGAIECKNIRLNFPLLASAVTRRDSEGYHDLIVNDTNSSHYSALSSTEKIRVHHNSLYPYSSMVVKRIDQIGRTRDGRLIGNDTNTFDKLVQAVNSAYDLVESASIKKRENFVAFICPILVIPDERLWVVEYSDDGNQLGEPKMVDNCSMYLNQSWEVPRGLTTINYSLSHLDIITFSYIENYISRLYDGETGAFTDNRCEIVNNQL